jgi:hypothetical protein
MTDLSPEAKALLELARDGDDPNPGDRARIRRALAAGIAAGMTGSATAAAASKSALGVIGSGAAAKTTIMLWLVAGAVAALAGSAALYIGSRTSEAPASTSRVVSPAPPSTTRAEIPDHAPTTPAATPGHAPTAASGNPGGEPVRAGADLRTSAGAARGSARNSAPAVLAALPAPKSSTLGAETALLESARTALSQGDSTGALLLLERHEREFPQGALVEERLAAKVFALCGLGRRAEASRTAAQLLQASPNSPLRVRVLDSCAYRP